MAKPAPKIDSRAAPQIIQQVQDLLINRYVKDWQKFELDAVTGECHPKGANAALVSVFARFAEIIIQRLNQVPDKNFLAFLDLLGASRLPPQPAKVPLTFFLAAGSAVDTIVPAATQVAAPLAAGEKEPTIFETDRDLVVTAIRLESVFVRNPLTDHYADYSAIATLTNQLDVPAFQGNQPIDHLFYIGHRDLFGFSNLAQLILQVTLSKPLAAGAVLSWQIWDGKQWQLQQPTGDVNLGRDENLIRFGEIEPIPLCTVNGQENRWLRCQLSTPITPTEPQAGMVHVDDLPIIKTIALTVQLNRSNQPIKQAFINTLPIDLSKDFLPFTEKPKFGDTFYLADPEAFSIHGAKVTLSITVTDLNSGIPRANPSDTLRLRWEFWDGRTWSLLGISARTGAVPLEPGQPNPTEFQDTTQGLSTDGLISFRVPSQPQLTSVNGAENYWIRVRLIAGNYGLEARYEPIDPERIQDGYRLIPATLAPPSLQSIQVTHEVTKTAAPEVVLAYNDFEYEDYTQQSFSPFHVKPDSLSQPFPSLYLGFTLPNGRSAFPNRSLSLFCRTADFKYGEFPAPITLGGEQPQLSWQYWNGSAWIPLTVRDDSEHFTQLGLVEVLLPADFAPLDQFEFGLSPRYWLRVQWQKGDYPVPPQLRRLLLSTTLATQTITIRNEILGSSDGSANQKFRAVKAPILAGQQLEVKEPEPPSAVEQAKIQREENTEKTITPVDGTGRSRQVWVRWHEVPDFYGSSPRDRHYVLNHLTGEVQFGDGINGLIPPRGNLRLTRYQTGGSAAGNRSAGTIVQLKTTIPYVESVTNTEAAAGGADAESIVALRDRAPKAIRHRNRAVTQEDYEDLAIEASSEVARAKCVPLRNLRIDPLDQGPAQPGEVSMIIVPNSSDPKPLTSLELIKRVEDYLQRVSIPTVNISVVGPLYVEVSITVEVALASLEGSSAVAQAVEQQLTRFLHPLTGGFEGTGWDFGRKPYKSDFYALLESIPGVDYIHFLQVDPPEAEDLLDDAVEAVIQTGRFLVYSGKHTINLKMNA